MSQWSLGYRSWLGGLRVWSILSRSSWRVFRSVLDPFGRPLFFGVCSAPVSPVAGALTGKDVRTGVLAALWRLPAMERFCDPDGSCNGGSGLVACASSMMFLSTSSVASISSSSPSPSSSTSIHELSRAARPAWLG